MAKLNKEENMESNTIATPAKPAATLRHGNLKCVLWRNEGERGPWYSAEISRVFKDNSGFHETPKIGGDDLLRVAFLAQQAYGELLSLKTQDKANRPEIADESFEP